MTGWADGLAVQSHPSNGTFTTPKHVVADLATLLLSLSLPVLGDEGSTPDLAGLDKLLLDDLLVIVAAAAVEPAVSKLAGPGSLLESTVASMLKGDAPDAVRAGQCAQRQTEHQRIILWTIVWSGCSVCSTE